MLIFRKMRGGDTITHFIFRVLRSLPLESSASHIREVSSIHMTQYHLFLISHYPPNYKNSRTSKPAAKVRSNLYFWTNVFTAFTNCYKVVNHFPTWTCSHMKYLITLKINQAIKSQSPAALWTIFISLVVMTPLYSVTQLPHVNKWVNKISFIL